MVTGKQSVHELGESDFKQVVVDRLDLIILLLAKIAGIELDDEAPDPVEDEGERLAIGDNGSDPMPDSVTTTVETDTIPYVATDTEL